MDCVKLTLLGTQRTADTANLAGCLDSRSTIVGAALYQMFCLVRYQVDQVFRAGCHAGTTRYTLLFVYTHAGSPHHEHLPAVLPRQTLYRNLSDTIQKTMLAR